MLRFGICVIAALGMACAAVPDVTLPSLFSDHMVLQQGERVPVWGWADPGEIVTVAIGTQDRVTKADAEGKWSVRLAPMQASDAPLTLTVKGGNETVIHDVLVGEVWVCSGQSNMQWPVAAGDRHEEEIAAARHPTLRMFTVKLTTADTPQKRCEGSWEVCTPETVGHWSAVGYFFGRELVEKLHASVGMINTSWGGTPAEAWTKSEALQGYAELQPILDRRTDTKIAPQNRAGQLYNAMVAPLITYRIRGAIWYQGEANMGRAWQYRTLFPLMIRTWRDEWGQGDFPFYYVQIAPFRYGDAASDATAELREAQTCAMSLPNTGMVVTMDIGNVGDIHPRNKQDVGRRLALWALARQYGRKVTYCGPLYDSMSVEGGRVRVKFQYAAGLETLDGGPPMHFRIAGGDGRFVDAQARIEGTSVVVWSEEVSKPVAVRYAWSDAPTPNLINGAGLPASPFRTDDWPAVTRDNR